ALKDGIPENTPQAKEMAVPINLETIGGNYLVIDIGGGLYAFYAHLIPGSLKVKLGDTVEPGQVLAALGNTGNSSEPHLHFHLIDNANPLAGQGQPYALSRFTRLKADMKLDAEGDIAQLKITGKEPVEKELLMNLEIVEFD
ncbi:MAG: M23 family metallopeptidase, partial [Candidatus Binatia bacterium]